MHTDDTIKQKSIDVPLDEGGRVLVRRMRWKAQRAFLRSLVHEIRTYMADETLAALMKAETREDKLAVVPAMLEKIPALIESSEGLISMLITATTGLTAEAQDGDGADGLTGHDVARILQAALSINLDAELKNSWTGIGMSLVGMVPGSKMTTRSSASSTPISSMPATPPPTSTPAPSTISTSSAARPTPSENARDGSRPEPTAAGK